MPDLHREIVFETEVVEHLTAHGWLEGDWQNYDREYANYEQDLIWWLAEANAKDWNKLPIKSDEEKEKVLSARARARGNERQRLASSIAAWIQAPQCKVRGLPVQTESFTQYRCLRQILKGSMPCSKASPL